ncbi:unnamed protein product [Rangifer tarandus platyrhynchus]|uniref:Uncharacterized protein n=2 Tax=Rangifer tarandus platyrhynchus TaxID=3082113 RepID=A0AC59ZFQ9_RANTA|nr:unnamed protein product [Rangifer tarandus platyrhynchus]
MIPSSHCLMQTFFSLCPEGGSRPHSLPFLLFPHSFRMYIFLFNPSVSRRKYSRNFQAYRLLSAGPERGSSWPLDRLWELPGSSLDSSFWKDLCPKLLSPCRL